MRGVVVQGIALQGVDWFRRLAWPAGPGAFRLWLAYLVVCHHLSSFGLGPFAVYVFFALSGFWVAGMWRDRYRRTRAPYLTFLASRLWRLAPVMLVASALVLAVHGLLGRGWSETIPAPARLAISSFGLVGYSWLPYAPLAPAWSLDVEAQFYLAAPVLVAAIARWPRLALVLAAVLSGLSASYAAVPVLPSYLVFFVVGVVAQWRAWHAPRWLWQAAAMGVPLVLVMLTLSPWRDMLWGGADPGPLFAWNPLLNIALALLALPFALHTVRQRSDGTDRAMGDLSYPVYLLHWGGALWFYSLTLPFAARGAAAVCVIVAVSCTSLLVWRFLDRPLERLRASWVARQIAGSEGHSRGEVAAP